MEYSIGTYLLLQQRVTFVFSLLSYRIICHTNYSSHMCTRIIYDKQPKLFTTFYRRILISSLYIPLYIIHGACVFRMFESSVHCVPNILFGRHANRCSPDFKYYTDQRQLRALQQIRNRTTPRTSDKYVKRCARALVCVCFVAIFFYKVFVFPLIYQNYYIMYCKNIIYIILRMSACRYILSL